MVGQYAHPTERFTLSTVGSIREAQRRRAAAGYNVAQPQGLCGGCGKAIAPEDKFTAALRETAIGFERVDLCLDCWQGFDRSGLLGFWRTTMPQPQAKRKIFVDDNVLCELFERLGSAEEPGKLNFRFVLGLILMRKRMLVYESSRVEGKSRRSGNIGRCGSAAKRRRWSCSIRGLRRSR